ncbi:hypothetical protein JYT16_00245 [Gemmatimonas aurantiaca]|nr:hypothetical protein [Gemmatimonas aurantiaca]
MLSNISRLLPYVLYLFLIAFHQTLVGDLFAIWGVDISSGALAIMLVALYKPQTVAVWFGAAVALLITSGDSIAAAITMVIASSLAVGAEYFKGRLNLESMTARLSVVFVGCLVFETTAALLFSGTGLVYMWFRFTIPTVVYTTLWGALFFMVKDGVISRARFTKLF